MVMYLVYWTSNDNDPSHVIKRTLPAAVEVFDKWVADVIEAGDYETDIIGLELIDDSQPDITIHSDMTSGARFWYGSEYDPDPDEVVKRCTVCGTEHTNSEDCPYDDHRGPLI